MIVLHHEKQMMPPLLVRIWLQTLRLAIALVLVLIVGNSLFADISLVNGSFESNTTLATNFSFSNPTVINPALLNANAVPGWFASAPTPGGLTPAQSILEVSNANTTGFSAILGREGANYGSVLGDILLTTRGADRPSIAAAVPYRLDFLLANDEGLNANAISVGLEFFNSTTQSATLLGGTTQTFNFSNATSPRTLLSFSLQATAPIGATLVGVKIQNVRTVATTGANQMLFDNFRITAVPEPSSIALIVAGALAFGWRLRKVDAFLARTPA